MSDYSCARQLPRTVIVESVSWVGRSSQRVWPPESDATGYLDQARQHLAATDNVYAAMWEHGRAVPAVLDLQTQQNCAYNPTPGRHTAAAQTTELFLQKKEDRLLTKANNDVQFQPLHQPSTRRDHRPASTAVKILRTWPSTCTILGT